MSRRSLKQCFRLALERSILRREMPQFQFYNPAYDIYVEGWASTSVGSGRYKLTAQVPPEYPHQQPGLYVTEPQTLWKHGGQEAINAMGTSHAFHTHSSDRGSSVKICYTSEWDASMTLVWVFLRGILWCEAFDQHLRTGRDLAEFLC